MRPLPWALVAFLLSVAVQVVVWRLRPPSTGYVGFLGLSATVLSLFLAGFWSAQSAQVAGAGFLPRGLPDSINFAMVYGSLVLAYMTTYSAVQGDSPTMAILARLEKSGSAGLTFEMLLKELDDQILVVARLNDLIAGGLVRQSGGRYVMAPRGAMMAAVYAVYRKLLRMEKGG